MEYAFNLPDLEGEVWKVADGYKFPYEVSNMGRIRNGVMYFKLSKQNKGYREATFQKIDGTKHRFLVHTMVAKLFVENHENKPYVDHINTDRSDNRACNLRWCTAQENNRNPITVRKMQLAYGNKRAVRCIETGQVFFSINEAERAMGLTKYSVGKHIRDVIAIKNGASKHGRHQSVKGYDFEYVNEEK
jgi:hypothetical protein